MRRLVWTLFLVLGCTPADTKVNRMPSLVINVGGVKDLLLQYRENENGEWVGGVRVLYENHLEPITVKVRCHDAEVALKCDLVTLDDNGYGNASVSLLTNPADIHEAVDMAIAICKLVKLPTGKILAWYDSGKYTDPLHSSVLQTGMSECKSEMSCEVRQSMLNDRPWNCIVEIYVSVPPKEAGEEARP